MFRRVLATAFCMVPLLVMVSCVGADTTTTTAVAAKVPPAAPSDLVTTAYSESLEITWADRSDNEDGFRVVAKFNEESGNHDIDVTVPAETSAYSLEWDSSTLVASPWSVSVSAFNSAGSGSASWDENLVVRIPIPAAPSNLEFTELPDSSIQLTWSDNSDNEQGFRLRSKRGNCFEFPAGTTSFAVPRNIDQSIFEGVQLCAYNMSGESASTEWVVAPVPESWVEETTTTTHVATANRTFEQPATVGDLHITVHAPEVSGRARVYQLGSGEVKGEVSVVTVLVEVKNTGEETAYLGAFVVYRESMGWSEALEPEWQMTPYSNLPRLPYDGSEGIQPGQSLRGYYYYVADDPPPERFSVKYTDNQDNLLAVWTLS